MVKILATEFVGPNFAAVASIFFGLLLLSAANTAIGAMVSVLYLLARDKELPQAFTRLNSFGMPWVGLVVATLVPVIVLAIVRNDSGALADLYAIGVVGAIAINLLACASNKEMELQTWERSALWGIGLLVAAIEITIAIHKPNALLFALIIIGVGLLGRQVAKKVRTAAPEEEEEEVKVSPSGTLAVVPAKGVPPAEKPVPLQPVRGRTASVLQSLSYKPDTPVGPARVLIPTRGSPKMMKFAIRYAKEKNATAYILFVREIALQFRERGGKLASESMTLANDTEARKVFENVREMCEKEGVHMIPIYVVHDSAAEMILDYAATLGVDTVLMGVSHRGAFWRTLKGDVVQEVVEFLPDSIPLLIHA
jgi:nucleotide-binding universal stress UspA family protein